MFARTERPSPHTVWKGLLELAQVVGGQARYPPFTQMDHPDRETKAKETSAIKPKTTQACVQTIIPFVLQERTDTRASMPKP